MPTILTGKFIRPLYSHGLLALALIVLSAAGCAKEKKAERPGPEQGVTRIEIERRILLGEGVSFGTAGSYETLTGRVYYALDPDDEHNRGVVDLKYAAGSD
ncbi:MAG: hypothetical protein U9N45_03550, partial [Gemmatimonadota bacterium]|nr:hypothetical protein [Gemmatimonadota bacterium]